MTYVKKINAIILSERRDVYICQFLNRGLSRMTQISRIIRSHIHNYFPKGEVVTKDLLKSASIRVYPRHP